MRVALPRRALWARIEGGQLVARIDWPSPESAAADQEDRTERKGLGRYRTHDRRPNVGALWIFESLRHHADDRVRHIIGVGHDLPPQHVRVAPESPLPSAIAQHHHGGRTPHVVGWTQRPAEHGRHAEHAEELARDEGAAQAVDPVAVANRRRPGALVGGECDPLERARASREFTRVIDPERIGEGLISPFSPQDDDAVLIADGEPAQEQRVGDREHRRRKADPQGEGDDRGQREPRGAAKAADTQADVRKQSIHQSLLISQGHDGIDPRRPTRGDVARERRDRGQQERDADKRQRISSPDAIQQSRQQA